MNLIRIRSPHLLPMHFLRDLLSKLLVGTPFARDVIPPLKSEPTLQRGGCAVVLKKDDSSYDVLAVQQNAPILTLAGGRVIHSRRSDSLWCKQVNETKAKTVEVNASLFVYHDNTFDSIPTSSSMRKSMVQEVLGAVLCRERGTQRHFKDKAVLELKLWLSRVKGLLESLRSRPYYDQAMEEEFIQKLEIIFDDDLWEQEVFVIVEREFEKVKEFEPRPTNFAASTAEVELSRSDMEEIYFQWNKPRRIEDAFKALPDSIRRPTFVGIGHEGVVFHANGFAYKVMDQVKAEDLPSSTILTKFSASFVEAPLPVIKSPFFRGGRHYRGGHGSALLQLLTMMKKKGLGTRNFSPDNIIIKEAEGDRLTLALVDFGRDLFMLPSSASLADTVKYQANFDDMCRRAFLCYRFGSYANDVGDLKALKEWMRKSSMTRGRIPQLEGFDKFMAALEESQEGEPLHHRLSKRLVSLGVTGHLLISPSQPDSTRLDGDAIDANKDDSVVLKLITNAAETFIDSSSGVHKLAVCVEDPFSPTDGRERRPLWFYRRHLTRLCARLSLSLSEEDIDGIDQGSFEECIKYHIFVLSTNDANERPAIKESYLNDPGCHLMIKSCPMEHHTILADVRRIVHTLERPSSFKSITLLVDLSISRNFLRQYTSCDDQDLERYKAEINQIKKERLVDHVIKFFAGEGNKEAAIDVNKRWFGQEGCSSTHSARGQQYASTLFGFDKLRALHCYNKDDLILQCNSDIIFNCDPHGMDGITDCLSSFSKDPRLLTLAFPTLSKNPPAKMMISDNKGTPYRFEIRCSFIHLARLASMLPLKVSAAERSDKDGCCITRGWWRVLDENIKQNEWKSCRGCLTGNNKWFFVHPQNSTKSEEEAIRVLAIGDRLANALPADSVPSLPAPRRGQCFAWQEQQGSVDLVYPDEWLCERNEPFVIVAYGRDVPYGRALRFLNSLRKQMDGFEEDAVGLILINDAPDNWQDINDQIYKAATGLFGNVSFLNVGKGLGWKVAIELAIDSICGQGTLAITFARLEGCFLGKGSLHAVWKRLSARKRSRLRKPSTTRSPPLCVTTAASSLQVQLSPTLQLCLRDWASICFAKRYFGLLSRVISQRESIS